jgi:hypothetical protein
MARPAPESRVTPPRTIIARTMPATTNEQIIELKSGGK